MKTFAVTVSNKKQERILTNLANELGIEMTVAKFKPLSTKDIALGIGRKITDEELEEYLERTSGGKPVAAERVKTRLNIKLSRKFSAK